MMRTSLVLIAAFAGLLAGCESAPPQRTEAPAAPPPAAAEVRPAPAPAPPPPAAVSPAPPPAPAEPPRPAPVEPARALFIKAARANFRDGAGTSAKIIAVLRGGTRVEVLEERNQWYRVRLADGREGWVAESVTSATPD
jgi:uncharacterized protein YgiM (DUF1202 family)